MQLAIFLVSRDYEAERKAFWRTIITVSLKDISFQISPRLKFINMTHRNIQLNTAGDFPYSIRRTTFSNRGPRTKYFVCYELNTGVRFTKRIWVKRLRGPYKNIFPEPIVKVSWACGALSSPLNSIILHIFSDT